MVKIQRENYRKKRTTNFHEYVTVCTVYLFGQKLEILNMDFTINKYRYSQNNLFIVKSTLKIVIHLIKLLQKNFECFNSKRQAHGTF